jgi:serine/threonine protein kinase
MDHYTINLRSAAHAMCLDGIVPEAIVKFIASEVVLALEFLHLKGFLYRDLKPENIMLSAAGHLVLCDYDLSKRYQGERRFAGAASTPSRRQRKHSFVGTPDYIAPEVIADDAQTPAVDWWCLGVLLYECLFGVAPFTGSNERDTLHRIEHHEHVPMPTVQEISKECRSFVLKLLDKRVAHRLGSSGGASEIKKHPWLAGVDFATVLSEPSPIASWVPPPPTEDSFDAFSASASLGDERSPVTTPQLVIDTGGHAHLATSEPFSIGPAMSTDLGEEFAFFHYAKPKRLQRERSMDELRAALAYSANTGATPTSTPHATPKKGFPGAGERDMVLPVSPPGVSKSPRGRSDEEPPAPSNGTFAALLANLRQRFYSDSAAPAPVRFGNGVALDMEMSPSV